MVLHQQLSVSSSTPLPFPGSSDSWPYPLTDSPYDSLANELDDGSRRGRLRTKPLRGSLDSFLTFSDYDQDTDPDLPATRAQTTLDGLRGVQQDPDTALPCPSQDISDVGTSSTLHSLSLEDQQRQRRHSEPAIKYMADFPVEDEDGEEEFSKRPGSHTLTRTHSGSQNRRRGCESKSGLREARYSSLSSTPTSPAQTPSSLDSIHSLGSDQTQQKKPPQTSFPSTPFTISSALDPGGHPEQGACPKGSPPKEPLTWGSLIGSRGLHPKSWLKKDRRLSRTQQDDTQKEGEEEKPMVRILVDCFYVTHSLNK